MYQQRVMQTHDNNNLNNTVIRGEISGVINHKEKGNDMIVENLKITIITVHLNF